MIRAKEPREDEAVYHVVAIEKFVTGSKSFIYHYPIHWLFKGGTGSPGLAKCRAFWKSSIMAASSAKNTRTGRRYRIEIQLQTVGSVGPASAFRYMELLPNTNGINPSAIEPDSQSDSTEVQS